MAIFRAGPWDRTAFPARSVGDELDRVDRLPIILEDRASYRDLSAVSSAQLQLDEDGAHAGSHKSGARKFPAVPLRTVAQCTSLSSWECSEWAQSAHSDDFCVSRRNMQRGADKLQARRFKKKHASQAAEAIGWAGRKRLVAADRAQRPPGKAGGAEPVQHLFTYIFSDRIQTSARRLIRSDLSDGVGRIPDQIDILDYSFRGASRHWPSSGPTVLGRSSEKSK